MDDFCGLGFVKRARTLPGYPASANWPCALGPGCLAGSDFTLGHVNIETCVVLFASLFEIHQWVCGPLTAPDCLLQLDKFMPSEAMNVEHPALRMQLYQVRKIPRVIPCNKTLNPTPPL